MTMDLFEGLSEAKLFENGVFLQPDHDYKIKVDRLLVKKARKGFNAFIMEGTILSSTSDKDPVGAKRSWLQKMEPTETAWPALKGFFYALLGYSFNSDKEFLAANVDPQLKALANSAVQDAGDKPQPFKGRTIGVRTSGIITKAAQKPFTRHDFYPTDVKLGG
jgi:hypothetical protein